MYLKSFYTIGLLILSNSFMTLAWYGHLKFKELRWFESLGLFSIILISWSIAFFEYMAQVPANRIGYSGITCSAKGNPGGYNTPCIYGIYSHFL